MKQQLLGKLLSIDKSILMKMNFITRPLISARARVKILFSCLSFWNRASTLFHYNRSIFWDQSQRALTRDVQVNVIFKMSLKILFNTTIRNIYVYVTESMGNAWTGPLACLFLFSDMMWIRVLYRTSSGKFSGEEKRERDIFT